MGMLYNLLKPVLRVMKIKRSAMSADDFEDLALKLQSRYKFELPKIKGYDVRDVKTGGCHCIVISKADSAHEKAVVYYAGGGYARYQLPNAKSIKNYITRTGRDMWIPLYPLFPVNTMLDAVKSAYRIHRKMLKIYPRENIAWLGFSAGADIVLGLGRFYSKTKRFDEMPGMIISVSPCNMYISERSAERMKKLAKTDVFFPADQTERFKPMFDPDGTLPRYVTGCAAENDYTGFPRTVIVFGGDEVFSAEAPEYEKAFRRCGVKNHEIHIEPQAFHGYPVFTFTSEGRRGERQMIDYLNEK